VKSCKYNGNGIFRIFNIIIFLLLILKNVRSIVKSFKPDVVVASSTYPMDIWPAKFIAKLAKSKLVYEVHDLWPLSPIELGGMSRLHPFILVAQFAENFAYKHSDFVVSMLPNTYGYMRTHGMEAQKWSHIPNGICEREWIECSPYNSDIELTLKQLRKSGKLLISYVGTFGLANALNVLLDAAPKVSEFAEIILLGDGPEKNKLQTYIRNNLVSNVTFINPISKKCVPKFLANIDVAYIGLMPQPLFRFGITPNKLFDYMMAGKPIIQAIEASNDLVSEAGCGITVKPGDPDAVALAINKLRSLSSDELIEMGKCGQEYVLKNHLYSDLAKRFLKIISD
jgi:glycosyltransferase involved in cell wall biosynthesis